MSSWRLRHRTAGERKNSENCRKRERGRKELAEGVRVRYGDTRKKCCRNRDRSRDRFGLRRRSGESISHDVLNNARNMHYRAGELSQVGQVMLLSGRPRWRNPEQSKSQRFVVSKDCKISTF